MLLRGNLGKNPSLGGNFIPLADVSPSKGIPHTNTKNIITRLQQELKDRTEKAASPLLKNSPDQINEEVEDIDEIAELDSDDDEIPSKALVEPPSLPVKSINPNSMSGSPH